jgi:hypothetical protein
MGTSCAKKLASHTGNGGALHHANEETGMGGIGTQTLYEMVRKWTAQPWNGIEYCRIAETLWDSIESSGLIEGPFGATATLLESCVVDSAEKVETGLIDGKQAVESLARLLQDDDFAWGARIIEVYVSVNPVCRVSNPDRLLQEEWPRGPQKPERWNGSVQSFWITMGAISLLVAALVLLVLSNYGALPPTQLMLSIIVGIPMYAMSYYFRSVATKRMWRALFIMLGAGGIGFWCLALPIALLFGPTIRLIPFSLRLPIMFVPVIMGGYIGARIGRARDCRPFM